MYSPITIFKVIKNAFDISQACILDYNPCKGHLFNEQTNDYFFESDTSVLKLLEDIIHYEMFTDCVFLPTYTGNLSVNILLNKNIGVCRKNRIEHKAKYKVRSNGHWFLEGPAIKSETETNTVEFLLKPYPLSHSSIRCGFSRYFLSDCRPGDPNNLIPDTENLFSGDTLTGEECEKLGFTSVENVIDVEYE